MAIYLVQDTKQVLR